VTAVNGPWLHNTRFPLVDFPVAEQPLGRTVYRQIGQRLRDAYGGVCEEPLPECFDRLINQINEQIRRNGSR
jgi:hypothetical protein